MMRAHLAILEKDANNRLDQSLGRRKERERERKRERVEGKKRQT